jgi:putative transferase (TIGR04331 family)
MILCVPCTFSRYQCYPSPRSTVPDNFNLQKKFSLAVSSSVFNHLLLRLFGSSFISQLRDDEDQMQEERLRWLDSGCSPRIYQGNMSFYKQLAKSRLCVCFYNGTPLLETFVANFPTILCWDPKYSELNALARPYFTLLKNVGILHETPESAASKLNKIYQNPRSWWMSPDVQDAKNKFCDRFARVSDDWLFEWKKELLALT